MGPIYDAWNYFRAITSSFAAGKVVSILSAGRI